MAKDVAGSGGGLRLSVRVAGFWRFGRNFWGASPENPYVLAAPAHIRAAHHFGLAVRRAALAAGAALREQVDPHRMRVSGLFRRLENFLYETRLGVQRQPNIHGSPDSDVAMTWVAKHGDPTQSTGLRLLPRDHWTWFTSVVLMTFAARMSGLSLFGRAKPLEFRAALANAATIGALVLGARNLPPQARQAFPSMATFGAGGAVIAASGASLFGWKKPGQWNRTLKGALVGGLVGLGFRLLPDEVRERIPRNIDEAIQFAYSLW